MSALAAVGLGRPAAARSRQQSAPGRSRLTLLPAPSPRAPRTPFVVGILLLLAAGLVALLMLNMALAHDSFALQRLQKETRSLKQQEQALNRDLATLQTPQVLSRKAIKLGMVPSDTPVFLRVAGGRLMGRTGGG